MRSMVFLAALDLLAFACADAPPAHPSALLAPSSNASLVDVPAYVSAHAALWRAIEKAQAEGPLELYGFEDFGEGEPSYTATVVFRSRRGAFALVADGNCQFDRIEAGRGDSVPAAAVSPAEFERLRARVAGALPLAAEPRLAPGVSLGVSEGATTRVLALRDGKLHSARWYMPETGSESASGPIHDRFLRARPVLDLIEAVRAAVPAELVPGEEVDEYERYATAPGY